MCKGVSRKLPDQQDAGATLTAAGRREAEGFVETAELLSLLELRARLPKRSAA